MLATYLVLFVAVLLPAIKGYANFAAQIPNGDRVPHPCKSSGTWLGVGHFNVDGGGNRNPFGQDFANAGRTWTEALCYKDSDGDGRTNGQELGDPDCTWRPGNTPDVTSGLSHPGICEPLDNPTCKQKTFDTGAYALQEEWMADVCDKGEFVCQGVNHPDTRNFTIRLPVSEVPPVETTYKCVILDLPELVDELHLIGTKPVFDNRQVLHHMVLSGCTGDISNVGVGTAFTCGMLAHENCSTFISIWTLGQNGECYHSDTGVRIGLNGFTRVALQLHWNNPELTQGDVDSSGMTLFYTPRLRPFDAAVLTIGNDDFVIPPGRDDVQVEASCTASCTRSIFSSPIYVTAVWNHMHYLGFSQTIEHFRGNTSLGFVTNDVTYSYDNPKTYIFDTPLKLLPGDELRTTCHYRSTDKTSTVTFGDSTQEEMCYGFLYVYPASALNETFCFTTGTTSFCDKATFGDCNPDEFYRHLEEYLWQDIYDNCTYYGRCYEECKAAIKKAKRTEPCMNHTDFWDRFTASIVHEDTLFLGALASCQDDLIREEMEAQCQSFISSSSAATLHQAVETTVAGVAVFVLLLAARRVH